MRLPASSYVSDVWVPSAATRSTTRPIASYWYVSDSVTPSGCSARSTESGQTDPVAYDLYVVTLPAASVSVSTRPASPLYVIDRSVRGVAGTPFAVPPDVTDATRPIPS